MWGGFATLSRTKKGQPVAGYPSARYGLLVETPAEPVFHPARERPARALGLLLARRARIGSRPIAAAGDPRARDGEDHTAEHHQEADHRKNREAADHGGLECNTTNQHGQTDHKECATLQTASRRRCAQTPAAHARTELGVLGIESALDLVEH